MYKSQVQQSWFSLTELMVAMALSLILILGITTLFSSLKSTSIYSQQLENTQEVLRFTSSIFSHAVHRADQMEDTPYTGSDGNTYKQLDLTFDLDTLDSGETYTSCLGNEMNSKYYESYRLIDNTLRCAEYSTTVFDETINPYTTIGINIDSLDFTKNSNLLTVTITPANETNSVQMMFAQRQAILGLNQ